MRLDPKSVTYNLLSSADVAFFHRTFYPNYVTILMYHGVVETPVPFYDWTLVDRASFREQMRYLKKNFEIVPLSSLPGRITAPVTGRPLAVVTFDDGYQNNFEVAYPVLLEERIPATVFLTTGLVDTDSTIWTCLLHDAITKTNARSFEWESSIYSLDGTDARLRTLAAVKDQMKKLMQHDKNRCLAEILSRLGADPDKKIGADSPYRILDSASIRKMASSGLIEFGGHTSTHPILSRLSSNEQEKELRESVEAVSRLLGTNCSVFAYPNGCLGDYNDESVRILKGLGVKTAVTTIEGYNTLKTPLLELKRYGVGAGTSMAQFKIMAHHLRSLLFESRIGASLRKN